MKWIDNMGRIRARNAGVILLFLGCSLVLLFYFSTYNGSSNAWIISCFFGVPSTHESFNPSAEDERNSKKSENTGNKTKNNHPEYVLDKDHQSSSPMIENSTKKEEKVGFEQFKSKENEDLKTPTEPLCDFTNHRSDVCIVDGDVRIHGNSSSAFFVTSYNISSTEVLNRTWRVKPFPRKFDAGIMKGFDEVVIRSVNGLSDAPTCNVSHSSPAVIFAIDKHNRNYYHDFNDLLVPLFITSRQFNGEVHFLMSRMNARWIDKYENIFKKLSTYPVIDFDNEVEVHCYPRTIVGLYSLKEFSIDPSLAPNNYSMLDFTKFMRMAYSLNRDSPISLSKNPTTKKPRLMIVARNQGRQLVNIDEVARAANELGYEVVAKDASSSTKVEKFARVVNSCDVLMGVHGAGLTNSIFLPTNGVLIQIVPFGMLEGVSMLDFGQPALDMKLKYLQYSISIEESTLIELYPRDHPVFKDPISFHKQGWGVMGKIYLIQQNVRLNITRFRPVLLEARDHLSR